MKRSSASTTPKGTPIERVRHIEARLSDENNRYRAIEPHKLLMSNLSYAYYDPSEEM